MTRPRPTIAALEADLDLAARRERDLRRRLTAALASAAQGEVALSVAPALTRKLEERDAMCARMVALLGRWAALGARLRSPRACAPPHRRDDHMYVRLTLEVDDARPLGALLYQRVRVEPPHMDANAHGTVIEVEASATPFEDEDRAGAGGASCR